MDRYESFARYAEAKRRIFMNQRETDFAVLNADDAVAASMASGLKSATALFSRIRKVPHGACVKDGSVVFRGPAREIELMPVRSIPLPGSHNVENVLAAVATAILAGAPAECLEESVRNFKGVEHRIEFVAEIDGVRYFNDSKATNVEAAIKSVESFAGNILMIAGGRDKGSDFGPLKDALRGRVKLLVLIGEAADAIRKSVSNEVDIQSAGTMEEAVALCRRLAGRGDVVLLAPACASFDMFRDYEHRGRVFKEAVRGLMR
jgi:UDP-N-acetylmuramoylalanine--D-glutamate ligase